MSEKLSIDEIQHIIETEGQGTIDMLPDGTVRRRSAEEFKQFQKEEAGRKCQAAATPRRHLIKELLDPHVSLTEREHAAIRLIGELASRLETTKMEIKNHACMRETLRQISVEPCDPSRHDEDSVCSPCHAKSYFESETDDQKA